MRRYPSFIAALLTAFASPATTHSQDTGPIEPRAWRSCRRLTGAFVLPALAVNAAASEPVGANGFLRLYLAHHTNPDFLDGFLVLTVLLGAMAIACFIVWLNARQVSIFRTMAAYLLAIAITNFVDFRSLSWEWIGTITACALSFELYAEALRLPKRIWIWFPRSLYAGVLIVGLLFAPGALGCESIEFWALHLTLYPLFIVTLAGVLRGSRRERMVSIPLFINSLAYLPTLQELNQRLHIPYGLIAFGWLWQWGELTQILLCGVVFAVFIRELIADQKTRIRLESELEAARAVQRILVPAENPSIPGFDIDAIYYPAGEVGGDFYQVVPFPSGGVLAVIGDVSGKGMPAAMTVSLLVGTFRTLIHYTQCPGEILAAMNQRMLAQSAWGFTTCLVVRLKQDGSLTAANAGHIPPYLAGKELALDNGLPLGIAPDAAYTETPLTLPPGAQLTQLTDGVVEASNPLTRELFGFDRTAAISIRSAKQIAAAAQQFGQEDDITVLTLTFAPVSAAAEVPHA